MKYGLVTAFAVLSTLGLNIQANAQLLGSADSFAVLAGSTVTNTGSSTVYGNLGVWPGTAYTGFPPGTVIGGSIYIDDAVAMQAQADALTAYNVLAGETYDENLTGQNLGGLTLLPGVYYFSSSAFLTGDLTLDAEGDPNAQFVFQIGSTLITASNSSVQVIDGGACNVYWQVGSSATLGTGTSLEGHILADASITLTTGASILHGGALALNGAVTMDTNQIATCPSPVVPGPGAMVSSGAGLLGLAVRRRRNQV